MHEELRARAYQVEVLERASKANAIVLLPTGAGKTLVAVELVKRQAHALTPGARIAVFKSKNLVRQQANVLRDHRKAAPPIPLERYYSCLAPELV